MRANAGQIDSIEREPNFDKVTKLPYGVRAHPTENDAIEAVNRIGLAELGTAPSAGEISDYRRPWINSPAMYPSPKPASTVRKGCSLN